MISFIFINKITMQNSHSKLSAKQQHKRSHNILIEEVFTEQDVNWNFEYNKDIGINFGYPKRWLDAFSHRKMIGVRRLDINPSAHKFDLQFIIIDDVISPKFNNNSWEIAGEEIVHTKPLIWEP